MKPDDDSKQRRKARPDPIAQRIRDLRVAAGMSLTQLAKSARVYPSHIFHIESGEKAPSEEVAARIARALGEAEEVYRAWARARGRSDLFTAAQSTDTVMRYLESRERAHLAAGRERATEQSAEAAEEDVAFSMLSRATAPQVRGLLGTIAPQSVVPDFAAASQRIRGAPSIPVIAEGEDPGEGAEPAHVVDRLELDPRALAALDRPFAYAITPANARRVPDDFPGSGYVVINRHFGPPTPRAIYAVRRDGRVALARAMWNGHQLLLLPAPDRTDFEVLPAASEADLAAHIVGVVAMVRPGGR